MWIAILVPFWMSVIVKNYAFTIILSREGLLSAVVRYFHVGAGPIDLLYTQTAVVIGMLYTMLPYVVVPAYVVFQGIDLELVRAAEGLGASRARAISSIVVPLALPGLFATTAIVFIISIGFYVTPVLLGGLGLPFMATTISQDIFTYYEYTAAAVSGALLLFATLLTLGLSLWLVGRERLERAIA
jgi:putative spermidine/putrescine transport system permease protein